MADSKISALTEATTLADADEFVIASSGASKRVKFSTLQAEVGGRELAYVEFTSNVSITATSEATATTVVTAPGYTFSGNQRIVVEFYSPLVEPGATSTSIIAVLLYDGSSSIGFLAQATKDGSSSGTAGTSSMLVRRFLTPSAASHTYSIRAFRVVSNGLIYAGAGGAGNNMPGYIRITTADSA